MLFEVLFTGLHEHGKNENYYYINQHTSSVTLMSNQKDIHVLFDTGSFYHRQKVVDGLKKHGLTPADITHVLMTHSHMDHTANCTMFENAETHINRSMLNHQDGICKIYPDLHGKPLPLNIEIFPSRGHTDDHVSYFINFDGKRYCIAGDAIREDHFLKSPPSYFNFEKRFQFLESARHIFESCDVIIPGHYKIIEGDYKDKLYQKLLMHQRHMFNKLKPLDKLKYITRKFRTKKSSK